MTTRRSFIAGLGGAAVVGRVGVGAASSAGDCISGERFAYLWADRLRAFHQGWMKPALSKAAM